MRLSEAIRLGATMKPQGFGHIFSNGKTCALGAAADAVGLLTDVSTNLFSIGLPREFKQAFVRLCIPCPIDGCRYRPVKGGTIIPHLNDIHQWTRERIADFVELHEPLPVDQLSDVSVNHQDMTGVK